MEKMKKHYSLGILMLLFLMAPYQKLEASTESFFDNFEKGKITSKWEVHRIDGSAEAGVNQDTSQNGSYSLFVNGGEVTVTSNVLDLSGLAGEGKNGSNPKFSAWIRRGSNDFSDYPESERDKLIVEYLDSGGSWRKLVQYDGGGAEGKKFTPSNVKTELPESAIHDSFQIRIHMVGGGIENRDYWHVDDFFVGVGAANSGDEKKELKSHSVSNEERSFNSSEGEFDYKSGINSLASGTLNWSADAIQGERGLDVDFETALFGTRNKIFGVDTTSDEVETSFELNYFQNGSVQLTGKKSFEKNFTAIDITINRVYFVPVGAVLVPVPITATAQAGANVSASITLSTDPKIKGSAGGAATGHLFGGVGFDTELLTAKVGPSGNLTLIDVFGTANLTVEESNGELDFRGLEGDFNVKLETSIGAGYFSYAKTYNIGLIKFGPLAGFSKDYHIDFSSKSNRKPVARAGKDQLVTEGNDVTLDGSSSSDPDGDSLNYSWKQTSGPSVSLHDTSPKKTSFTTPEVSNKTTLTFELTVTDPDGESSTDRVNVSVENKTSDKIAINRAPKSPSVRTPDDGKGNVSFSPLLSWKANDPDGDELTYDVYFGPSSSPSFYKTIQDTSIRVGDLSDKTTYYWKIVVSDGRMETEGPVWRFTTTSSNKSVHLKNVKFQMDSDAEPLDITDSNVDDLEVAFNPEYEVDLSENDKPDYFTARVIDISSGLVIGSTEKQFDSMDQFNDYSFDVDLELTNRDIFRKPGSRTLRLIFHSINQQETVKNDISVDVNQPPKVDGQIRLWPRYANPGEQITLDASHLNESAYDWIIERNGEFYRRKSGAKITLSPVTTGSFDVLLRNPDTYEHLDDARFWVRNQSDLEPELSVARTYLSDSTVLPGEEIQFRVTLENTGETTAHFTTRYFLNGQPLGDKADAYHVDPDDTTKKRAVVAPYNPGSNTLKAVITDCQNETIIKSRTISVSSNAQPNIPSKPRPLDGEGEQASDLTLKWNGGDPNNGDNVQYRILLEHGDPSPDTILAEKVRATSFSPSSLQKEKTYYWKVIAVDEHGATQSGPVWSFSTMSNTNPEPSFAYSPDSPTVGETVDFSNNSFDPDGTIQSFAWSFGDGDLKTKEDPSVTYEKTGSYTVRLTVTDDDGEMKSAEKSISIDTPTTDSPPTADFDFSPSSASIGESITFFDNSKDDLGISSRNWDFGDGATGSGSTAEHTYSNGGEYRVTLTVTDSAGQKDSETKTVRITFVETPRKELRADFHYLPEFPKVDEKIEFYNQSSYKKGTVENFAWDFGDGVNSDKQNPSHSFSSSGTYLVELTIETNDGKKESITRSLFIRPKQQPAPPKMFSAMPMDRGVLLDWEPSPSKTIDHYLVRYSPEEISTWNTDTFPATATSGKISGLSNGTEYNIEILTVSFTGIRSQPKKASVTPFFIHDSQGKDYSGLQNAIDNVANGGGGTVYLSAETYSELDTVRIWGGVSLKGTGPGFTRIKGKGSSPVITLDGLAGDDSYSISHLSVVPESSSGDGLYLTGSVPVFLHNLIIRDHERNGVKIGSAPTVSVYNNHILSNGRDGIHTQSDKVTLRNNLYMGNGKFAVDNGSGSSITAAYFNAFGNNGTNPPPFNPEMEFRNVNTGNHFISKRVPFRAPKEGDYRPVAPAPTTDQGAIIQTYEQEKRFNGTRVNIGAFGNTQWASGSSLQSGRENSTRSYKADVLLKDGTSRKLSFKSKSNGRKIDFTWKIPFHTEDLFRIENWYTVELVYRNVTKTSWKVAKADQFTFTLDKRNSKIFYLEGAHVTETLQKQSTYEFLLRVYYNDGTGKEIADSVSLTATTGKTKERNHGGSDGGSSSEGCFLATASYGTKHATGLQPLRAFRDDVMLTNSAGEVLVNTYYAASPPVADFLAQKPFVRSATKYTIVVPVSAVVRFLLDGAGFLFSIMCFLLILVLSYWYGAAGTIVKAITVSLLTMTTCSFLVLILGGLSPIVPIAASIAVYILPLIMPLTVGFGSWLLWRELS